MGEASAYGIVRLQREDLCLVLQHALRVSRRWRGQSLVRTDRDDRRESSSHTLLGQAVEYDLGNIYDPAYVMVCKIRKDTLRSIGLRTNEP